MLIFIADDRIAAFLIFCGYIYCNSKKESKFAKIFNSINGFIMRKLIVLALAALCFSFVAHAQIGNLIKNKINQKAEEEINKAVDKAVDNAVDKTFDNTKKAIEKEKNDNSSSVSDDAHDHGGWTCPACGAKGNTGNFCKECAAKKPEASSQSNTASNGWKCPACGHEGNTGKFCNECGAKKPEATAADDSWTCPQCGHKGNKGNSATNVEQNAMERSRTNALSLNGTNSTLYLAMKLSSMTNLKASN